MPDDNCFEREIGADASSSTVISNEMNDSEILFDFVVTLHKGKETKGLVSASHKHHVIKRMTPKVEPITRCFFCLLCMLVFCCIKHTATPIKFNLLSVVGNDSMDAGWILYSSI